MIGRVEIEGQHNVLRCHLTVSSVQKLHVSISGCRNMPPRSTHALQPSERRRRCGEIRKLRLTSMNFSLLRSKSWSSSTPRYEYFLKDRAAFLAAASSPEVKSAWDQRLFHCTMPSSSPAIPSHPCTPFTLAAAQLGQAYALPSTSSACFHPARQRPK